MTRRLFYTDHHVLPLPPQHRFPIEKYRMLRELLQRDGLFSLEAAPLADLATIGLVHEAEYVDAFMNGRLNHETMRRIGFPWSEGLVRRTLASVGATLAATREALTTGWGGTLAGGTHHAFAGAGSGFCVFNDIAVAARWAQSETPLLRLRPEQVPASVYPNATAGETPSGEPGGRGGYPDGCSDRRTRVAVIDLDVHQGDGTADIFRGDPSVLTLSVHCKANFPLRKQQSSIDVELEAGAGDQEYLGALEAVLPRVWEFRPDIVFYQAGVDALASDRLGRLRMSHTGLMERDRMVMGGVRAPFVITVGGGYSEPIELTAKAHANTFRVAAEMFGTGNP